MSKNKEDIIYKGIITNKDLIKGYFAYESYEDRCFNGWEYDLRLGCEYYSTTTDLPVFLDASNPHAVIRSGDFALLITKEKLMMPLDVMAFISIKFSYKQKGLINISGFHVDPGYEGKIIFSVYNAGPNDIILRRDDCVFMIFFQGLGEKIEKKSSGNSFDNIPVQMISAIRGRSVSLSANAEKIERIEHYVKFYGAIAVTIIIMLLGIILRGVLTK
jgi:dCTP deaminase